MITPAVLSEGGAILDKARQTGLKSQRERDYVDALAAFFRDHEKLDHKARAQALETALEQVMQRYPEDKEAVQKWIWRSKRSANSFIAAKDRRP